MSEEEKDTDSKMADAEEDLAAAVLPILQSIVGWSVDKFADIRAVDIALRALSPGVILASNGLPNFVGLISSKLGRKLFTSDVARDLFKDSLLEAARHVTAKVQEKGGMKNITPQEYGDAVKDGFRAAMEKKYVIIDRLLHSPSCAGIQSRLAKPPAVNVEITLLEAEQQHFMRAPCCFDGVQADIKAQAAAPAKAEASRLPPRSPMEVINRAKPKDRVVFFTWLKGLPADERVRVDAFLKHLDSEEELHALLHVIKDAPDLVYELLTLLENSNGSHRTAQYLLLFGQAIERHSMQALTVLKVGLKEAVNTGRAFDASFAPVAKRLRDNDAGENPRITVAVLCSSRAPEKEGVLKATARFVKSLFLIF